MARKNGIRAKEEGTNGGEGRPPAGTRSYDRFKAFEGKRYTGSARFSAVLLLLAAACGPPPASFEGEGGAVPSLGPLSSVAWTTPERLDAITHNANWPKVALDGRGNAIAAWNQQVNYPAKVFVNHFDVEAQAWGEPQLLESGGRVIGDGPHLAMNPSGQAALIWQQRVTEPHRIFVSLLLAGAEGWTTPQAIDSGGDLARDPQVAIDDAGNAIAIWWANPAVGTPASIFVRRYRATQGTWSAAQEIDDCPGNALEPKVAMDGSGNATAVWTQSMAGGRFVVANRYQVATDAWGSPVPISEVNVLAPRVARDGHGRSLAIWQQSCGSMSCIHYSRFTAAAGWSPAQVIPGSEGAVMGGSGVPDRLTPDLAINADGSAMLVWAQRKSASVPLSIYASRFSAFTEHWSVGPTLLERIHQPAFRPQVAVDAQSNATAVWAQITTEVLDGVPRRIFSVFRNVYTFETRGWGDAQPLEQSPFTAFGSSVAMNAAGQAAAAWSQWVGDYPGIFASRAAD